jgi:hypothetical protein
LTVFIADKSFKLAFELKRFMRIFSFEGGECGIIKLALSETKIEVFGEAQGNVIVSSAS